jgi:hypothetical protein
MKKTKMLALALVLGSQMLATFAYAETLRCCERVDTSTTVNYAWTKGDTHGIAIVKVNGKQVATYKIEVVDVPCEAGATC